MPRIELASSPHAVKLLHIRHVMRSFLARLLARWNVI